MQSKSLFIALFATIVRYYDYSLLGLSASVLAEEFMPGDSKVDRLLNFFGIFSLSMIARPVGSIIFGRIGDRIGRIASVKIATLIAATTTSLIAIIPSYKTIGISALICLMCCRMLFLISLAGEIDAIKIYIAEKVSKKNKYVASGIVSFSAQIGVLIAALTYYFAMQYKDLWRLSFAIGGGFGFLIILMRNYLKESEIFLNYKSNISSNDKILSLIKDNKIKFILAILVNGAIGGSYNFLIIFLNTFIASTNLVNQEIAQFNNIFLIATYGIGCFISGYVADKLSNIFRQIKIALISSGLLITLLLILNVDEHLLFFHYFLTFLAALYVVPCQVLIQSSFKIGIRMRMCSLSHSIGSMLLSSTTPMICMFLWKYNSSLNSVLIWYYLLLIISYLSINYISKNPEQEGL